MTSAGAGSHSGAEGDVGAVETEDSGRVHWRLLGAAILVLALSNVTVNLLLPAWAYVLWNMAVAAGLFSVARRAGMGWSDLGLDRSTVARSVRVGLLGALSIAVLYAIALTMPATRALFDDLRVSGTGGFDLWYHTLIQIPLGTVVLEELAFRGVLPAALGMRGAGHWRWRAVLVSSFLFGLWHVLPSAQIATGNTGVAGAIGGGLGLTAVLAVLGTTIAGIVLCWWRWAGRGLLSAVLVHIATNSMGFAVAWALSR